MTTTLSDMTDQTTTTVRTPASEPVVIVQKTRKNLGQSEGRHAAVGSLSPTYKGLTHTDRLVWVSSSPFNNEMRLSSAGCWKLGVRFLRRHRQSFSGSFFFFGFGGCCEIRQSFIPRVRQKRNEWNTVSKGKRTSFGHKAQVGDDSPFYFFTMNFVLVIMLWWQSLINSCHIWSFFFWNTYIFDKHNVILNSLFIWKVFFSIEKCS